jgi:hypothetical protein
MAVNRWATRVRMVRAGQLQPLHFQKGNKNE